MNQLVRVLRYQRDHHIDGNVYKACQCDFAYNSNHMEGSTLTHDQTVQIFDRDSFSGTAKVDDIVEARNHFEAFDHVLDTYDIPLTAGYLCELHAILKAGTSDAADPTMSVGRFKRVSNYISGAITSTPTASPEDVPRLVDELLGSYDASPAHTFDDIVHFHWRFESIHPFSDGNGRIGRLVAFKECLAQDMTPFIITEDIREFYIRGLREYEREPGYLTDTCGHAQDRFEALYMPMVCEFARAMDGRRGKASDDQGQSEGAKRARGHEAGSRPPRKAPRNDGHGARAMAPKHP